ncbi:Abi family protein [Patescibacteria group bacterium]|nr:Abi family protein [Patescibacteria group bacterium]
MSQYTHSISNIRNYIQKIYVDGLNRSKYLSDIEIEEILTNIGLFKFKGYVRAYKTDMNSHSIDNVLMLYFFDKYLTRIIMDITSSVETKLKTTLVELCYKQIKGLPNGHSQKNNPFFYLIQDNYKMVQSSQGSTLFSLNYSSVATWKNSQVDPNENESYLHYGLYYKNTYDFGVNRQHFLNTQTLMNIHNGINYPPFHYFIESATLGTVLQLVKYLKIDNYDVLQKVAAKFGVTNTNVDFAPYLERLQEVRNRAAHRERIFNRSYRSITRVSHFHNVSQGLSDHKFIDVYMFLFFMMGKLDNFQSAKEFESDEIKRLFRSFKKDYFIRRDSKMLTKKVGKLEFEKMKKFTLGRMR